MPYVQWVVKVSKLCNLRCTYCYEFPFLGDSRRMSSDELRRMFQHIADYYRSTGQRMDFVWHGGEPLLIPAEYYWKIGELQKETLGAAGVPFTNSVQTNLTRLSDEVLNLLSEFFTYVGCSVDLFGDQRVDVAGRPSQDKVLRNMQVLIDRRIRFGCIVVLSQQTLHYVKHIYHFFEDIDTSFRILPIYRTGYEHQHDNVSVSEAEIVAAFREAVDLWFASSRNIQVRPIQDYVTNVLRQLSGASTRRRFYNKQTHEAVYIVDTDGALFSNADAYDRHHCYGNLFHQPLTELRSSDGYQRAVLAANDRMARTCAQCRFHGACSGYFMGEATPEQRYVDERGHLRCGVAQPVQSYIAEILSEHGLISPDEHLRLGYPSWDPLTLHFSG